MCSFTHSMIQISSTPNQGNSVNKPHMSHTHMYTSCTSPTFSTEEARGRHSEFRLVAPRRRGGFPASNKAWDNTSPTCPPSHPPHQKIMNESPDCPSPTRKSLTRGSSAQFDPSSPIRHSAAGKHTNSSDLQHYTHAEQMLLRRALGVANT